MAYIFSSLFFCSFMFISSLYCMEYPLEEKSYNKSPRKQYNHLPIPKFNELPQEIIITTPSNPIINNPTLSSSTITPQSTKFSDAMLTKPELPRSKSFELPSKHTLLPSIKIFSKSDSAAVENTSSTSSWDKKKSSSSSLLPSISLHSPRGKSPRKELNLIQAIRNENIDLELIQSLINNPDINPNEQDQYGNTALHHEMLKLNKTILLLKSNQIKKDISEIIKNTQNILILLLLNPKTDSTITNNHGMSAASLLQGSDFLSVIRTLIFAHDSLTRWVKRETEYILLDTYLNNTYIDKELIKQAVANIKKGVLENESGGSTQMPQTAQLPLYATDEFIFDMVNMHLPEPSAKLFKIKKQSGLDKITLHRINLNNLFSQKIKSLLSIEESAADILNEINSNNAYKYLAPYITKQSISKKLILLLYNTDSLSEIPTLIFAHNILIEGIKREIEDVILDTYLNNTSIGNKVIKQSVENVRKDIYKTKSIQKQIILFPPYATDEYISIMIKSHLPESSAKLFTIKKSSESDKINLNNLFSQEISNILFNVSITNEVVEQSIEIILKEIRSNKAYKHLAHYVTKQSILRKLKLHVAQQKPDLKEIFDKMILQEDKSQVTEENK